MFKGDKEGNVTANGKPLRMTPEARKSSPTGFNWGYGGSGAYALAHSMLAHLLGNHQADMWASQFKWGVIVELPYGEEFELSYAQVRKWVKDAHHDMLIMKHR